MSLSETISISICDIAVQLCGHMQDKETGREKKNENNKNPTG